MVTQTEIDGVTLTRRKRLLSATGSFVELHNDDAEFDAAQVSLSTIDGYVLRGIHFTTCPPSQRKTVTCISGEVVDLTIDLRADSSTFLNHQMIKLASDDEDVVTLHLAPWIGHALYSNKPSSIIYTHSVAYNPDTERTLYIFDPALDVNWTGITPKEMSLRDQQGFTLKELIKRGDLPLVTLERMS